MRHAFSRGMTCTEAFLNCLGIIGRPLTRLFAISKTSQIVQRVSGFGCATFDYALSNFAWVRVLEFGLDDFG